MAIYFPLVSNCTNGLCLDEGSNGIIAGRHSTQRRSRSAGQKLSHLFLTTCYQYTGKVSHVKFSGYYVTKYLIVTWAIIASQNLSKPNLT